jgi:four helix bundle protein
LLWTRLDFINKLAGAIEEVDESALWLEILVEAGICGRSQTAPLWREADELTRILVRSHQTAKARSSIKNRESTTDRQSKIKNH